ncbi:MAG TPA: YetF domain-containing protein [Bryobacteraceae bacterium]|jgi:uncharacterized membrane protein YcaP (DUF421 family)|nr:YetF domain-containing protein [Bryobacteraceae bacterium]
MDQLTGGAAQLGWVALKALLLYVTAVFGFRLGERRTLAEMSAFDFIAAVGVGAIIGRVPNASTTSYLAGAVTLVTILAAHRIISKLRQVPQIAELVDHPPRILLSDGKILRDEIRKAGLTQDDLYGILRQHGVTDLNEIRLVVFEQRGKVSVIKSTESKPDSQLISAVRSGSRK